MVLADMKISLKKPRWAGRSSRRWQNRLHETTPDKRLDEMLVHGPLSIREAIQFTKGATE
jgi:hypothetical protein